MDVAMLIGRILFGLVFLGGAAGHFLETDMLVKIVEAKGLRPARPLVLASGVVQLAGALMVVLGLWPAVGALMLVAFLIPTAVLIHNFWTESDPQQKMLEQVHFNKDISLAGAALFLAAVVAEHGDEMRFVITG